MKKITLSFLVLTALLASCLKDDIISSKAQLQADVNAIQAYLTANNISAIKLPEGVWYSNDTVVGMYPTLSDSVVVGYVAKVIESSVSAETALEVSADTVLLSKVIAGWQLILPRITSGSSCKLYIPSGLAFGTVEYNGIKANSNLIYEVQFKKIKITSTSHFSTDTSAISDYLTSQGINAKYDASGIRYVRYATGSGPAPVLTDSIVVKYKGKILGRDSLFAKDSTKWALNDYVYSGTGDLSAVVPAWKIMLPKIKEGDSIVLYVPSGYGYGSAYPTTKIPANSNLEYHISLKAVIHQ